MKFTKDFNRIFLNHHIHIVLDSSSFKIVPGGEFFAPLKLRHLVDICAKKFLSFPENFMQWAKVMLKGRSCKTSSRISASSGEYEIRSTSLSILFSNAEPISPR